MKQTIKLTESELKRMITESVKRTLNEWDGYNYKGFNEPHDNPEVEELIKKTLDKLPGNARYADNYVEPIIRGAIKRAYELGCQGCEVQ